MTTIPLKKPVKIINLEGSRRLILVNAENVNVVRESRHRKANTQNVNIYNIIHNEPRLPDPLESYLAEEDPLFPDRSFAEPALRPKEASRKTNLHESALREELRLYKVEVERRFNQSSANKEYAFPRSDMEETANGSLESIDLGTKDISLRNIRTFPV